MKVIVAGPPKTGTKSMNRALDTLGYSVYDYTENIYFLNKEWMEIFQGKGTVEHFRRMYKDVDATMDTPANYFWKEILDAFPDSKIILTIRDSEDVWLHSMVNAIMVPRNPKYYLLFLATLMTPVGWHFWRFLSADDKLMFGGVMFRPWGDPINEMTLRQYYRRQIADVMQNAPKDQLLVFNCKEGWEPLCNFLGVPVPEGVPFPHSNISGEDFLENHVEPKPIYEAFLFQIKIASMITGACVVGLLAFKYFVAKK